MLFPQLALALREFEASGEPFPSQKLTLRDGRSFFIAAPRPGTVEGFALYTDRPKLDTRPPAPRGWPSGWPIHSFELEQSIDRRAAPLKGGRKRFKVVVPEEEERGGDRCSITFGMESSIRTRYT